MNDYCGKTYDYISDYTIPGYPLRRASQTVQKLFEVTLLYLYCRQIIRNDWESDNQEKLPL
jgi:hypothetical protein